MHYILLNALHLMHYNIVLLPKKVTNFVSYFLLKIMRQLVLHYFFCNILALL